MKNKRIIKMGMILLSIMYLAGCFRSGNVQTTATPAADSNETSAPAASVASVAPTDVTDVVLDSDYVKNLFARSSKIPGYSYKVSVLYNDEISEEYIVWGQGQKHKMQAITEQGDGRVTVFDNEKGVFSYDLISGTGYHTDYEENIISKLFFNETNFNKFEFRYVSQEVENNIPCVVLQWQSGADVVKRAWISEEYGIVLKMNVTSSDGTVAYTTENLVVEELPENTFNIPTNIEISER